MEVCPNDIAFASYIQCLELAGITEENLRATGLLKEMETRMARAEIMIDFPSEPTLMWNESKIKLDFPFSVDSEGILRLPTIFQNGVVLVRGEMKRFGHHAENILVEMNVPEQLLKALPQAMLDIKKLETEEKKYPKAM